MSSLSKGVRKAEVSLRWDPSPMGEAPHDLDLVAGMYEGSGESGDPAYVVHFDSRSPDGTIILNRHSDTGQGFGDDEVLTLEFDRMAPVYGRVVVGVVIQQRDGRRVFGDIAHVGLSVEEDHRELAAEDFSSVSGSTAAVVCEFRRSAGGAWTFQPVLRGHDADPEGFLRAMGR
ncbi:TerD family protein [Streptomyces sanyensis]|uniref:TerD family protein n=1 Tax=Streptomyces TaxID=1883 RepID=UPI003D765B30